MTVDLQFLAKKVKCQMTPLAKLSPGVFIFIHKMYRFGRKYRGEGMRIDSHIFKVMLFLSTSPLGI